MRSDRRWGWPALIVLVLAACANGVEGAEPFPSPMMRTTTVAATTVAATTTTTVPTTTATTVPTTTTTTVPTTTTTAVAASTVPTTPAAPLGDVVVIGDSLSAGLAAPLRAALDDDTRAFDWRWWVGFTIPNPSKVWENVLTVERPDVVVLFIAAWESEVIRSGKVIDPDDPAWRQQYVEEHVAPWLDLVRRGETEILWVAMPPSLDPVASAHHQQLNDVWRRIAAAEPAITWIETSELVAGSDGEAVEHDASVEPAIRLFALDGLHLCPPATERVADEVLIALGELWDVDPVAGWRASDWESYPDAFGEGSCPTSA